MLQFLTIFAENLLSISDMSESLEITFSVITFSLSFFFIFNFSIKVIFKRILTLSAKIKIGSTKNPYTDTLELNDEDVAIIDISI